METLKDNLTNFYAYTQFKADLTIDLEHCEPESFDYFTTEAELVDLQEDLDIIQDNIKIQLT